MFSGLLKYFDNYLAERERRRLREIELKEARRIEKEINYRKSRRYLLVHDETVNWLKNGRPDPNLKSWYQLYENELGERRYTYRANKNGLMEYEKTTSYYESRVKDWLSGVDFPDIDSFSDAEQNLTFKKLKE